MLTIRVLAVGRVRTPGVADAIAEYENRLRHYFRFEAIPVDAAQVPDTRAGEGMAEEGDRLAKRLADDDTLVALTRTGRRWATRDLAERIADAQNYGGGGALAFVIGGAHGLADAILERATHRLSLSDMTLPHEIARLVLTEQLYRAGTILRSEPYHKGP
ncbi:MAG: 23S rRNA (pseudouridine(1915)-N(3))-methyltransferase RlmH [Gemmatimonadota bacterium]|nr:23S rRNA (pseudouridine(1915)-N(3))-methyltransferase RlmH [Gemmatimonadota bacterium]